MSSNLFFEKPVSEIIKARRSVRTYDSRRLAAEIKEKLAEYLSGLKGPFNTSSRLKLLDSDIALKESNIKLGTYGMIRGATTFAVAAVEKSPMDLEELGYLFEKLVLYATSLGLGTCWLGGSFKKSEFAKAMELGEKEMMPIVIPIGYPADGKSFFDSIVRFAAGSNNRKAWEELFYGNSFESGLRQTDAAAYTLPLEMVRLAPSASNKQPWRIVRDSNKFHFYLQHTKGYAKMVGYDIQRLDIGIAMCHFDLSARESGISGSWQVQAPSSVKLPQECDYIVSWVED